MLGLAPLSAAPISALQGAIGPTISPTGIAGASAFGTPVISLTIAPTGLASAGAFGTPSVSVTVSPTGIVTAGAFGTPSIAVTIAPGGIAGASAFGTPVVSKLGDLACTGIAGEEAFGIPSLIGLLPGELEILTVTMQRIDWLLMDGTRIEEVVHLHTDVQVLPEAHHVTDLVVIENPNADIGSVSFLNPTVLSVLIH